MASNNLVLAVHKPLEVDEPALEVHKLASRNNTIPLVSDREQCKHYWNQRVRLKWMLTFFVGNILLYSARSTMSISVPAMSKELGWNKQVSGMALSAFFGGYLCTNMLGGYVADRIGGEVVICYTGVGWASLTVLLPYIARSQVLSHLSTAGVILSRFLTGLSQGVFYPSMSAIMSKHIAQGDKGFFGGFTNSGGAIGSAATGLFGSVLLEYFSWSLGFIIVGSLALLWILWLRYLIAFHVVDNNVKVVKATEQLPWVKLGTSAPFWGMFIAYFTGSYVFLNWLSWAPVYFHDTFPGSKAWIFNSIPWILAFLNANVCGYIGNLLISRDFSVTFVRKLFTTFHLLGFCFCSIALNYVATFQQALFIMSVNIGANAFSNCGLTLSAQDLAPNHAGALHGFMNGFGALSGVIGVYLTGYILKATGKWPTVFLVNAVLSFIGGVSFLIFGSGERVV